MILMRLTHCMWSFYRRCFEQSRWLERLGCPYHRLNISWWSDWRCFLLTSNSGGRDDGNPFCCIFAFQLPEQLDVKLLNGHLGIYIVIELLELVPRAFLLIINRFSNILENFKPDIHKKIAYLMRGRLPFINSINFIQSDDKWTALLLEKLDRLTGLVFETVHDINH